jgi:replicative DNA helicase Mcm
MRFYQSLGVGEPAGVVSHLSEYLITELNEVEIQVRRQLNETRERLEATHIHDESMSQDLREQIQDAVADYHAEDPEDDENTDENAESIKIKKVVRELQESHEDGAPVEKVYNRCLMRGLSEEEIEDRLKKLKDRADIYEPKTDHLRVV